MKKTIILVILGAMLNQAHAQKLLPFKLQDTGQTGSYSATAGEDADYAINPPSLTDNGNGTITDNNTGLMWQKTDGGEMTWESAASYCTNLTLAGFDDWRLPTGIELFSINNYNHLNPAMDPVYFTTTQAEYWWSSEKQADDAARVWVVNAGGGIGAHPKTETIAAGGTKRFHVRAVRNVISTTFSVTHYTDNNDGTVTDNFTGLTWQKIQSPNTLTWEEALAYAGSSTLAGKSDWRLPNIKEIQSLNDVSLFKPSFNKTYFTGVAAGNYWSSTTMYQTTAKAWDINVDYGIVSYSEKTLKENVLLVRGGADNATLDISEAFIPGGQYAMGDHFGFVDPQHPSDEIPIHNVLVDSFYMTKTETTNQQFLAYLNESLLAGRLEVRDKIVYRTGGADIWCYTNQYEPWYSISFDGTLFTLADFRATHPMTGVMWFGAADYCNWLSRKNGLQECYDTITWACNFSQNGYRLPTEAEWEFAGRGGHIDPYYNYPNGNTVINNLANLPVSGDPYETGPYPNTTPAGFYDGTVKLKSDYNWPGNATTYQTSNGANGFGLYDMQGNVWELLNDWYGQNYYSISPYNNPTGPETGFIMPDGKPYRGMRGGNWYNGYTLNGVNDGHSRVSNRNPSYYRGPQDPNHPWYHIGFRMVRKNSDPLGLNNPGPGETPTVQRAVCFPNPFVSGFTVKNISGIGTCELVNRLGQTIWKGISPNGEDFSELPAGIYFLRLNSRDSVQVVKVLKR